jgi:hypothetical protein
MKYATNKHYMGIVGFSNARSQSRGVEYYPILPIGI